MGSKGGALHIAEREPFGAGPHSSTMFMRGAARVHAWRARRNAWGGRIASRIARCGLAIATVVASSALTVPPVSAETPAPTSTSTKPATISGQKSDRRAGGTADHTKFEILREDFKSGPEVTKACLSCHTEAAKQVKASIHWSWTFDHPRTGQPLGKSRVLNSFCTNVSSNEPRCTSCHAGYGWEKLAEGPPAADTAVDCLVCHDRTGGYSKLDNAAGRPPLDPVPGGAKTTTGANAVAVNLAKVAQGVGMPGRENCAQCHFYGGGGDNVKHGDLSSVLIAPSKQIDVHMAPDGANLACTACHVSKNHRWAGSRYDIHSFDAAGPGKPGERREVATCASCHGDRPHPGVSVTALKLNDHTATVACQACHIPSFARGGVATKVRWDWSTAGRLRDGKPFAEENYTQANGKHLHTYLSTKGDFEWAENVTPHYAWFDGQVRYTTTQDKLSLQGPVEINRMSGAPDDPASRIWPFKKMRGKQAYDTELLTLLNNHVYGVNDDTALWSGFDFARSLKAGTEYAGQPFSGKFGFVETIMYWPITHMVAPKADAVACGECHSRDGRLAGVSGVYMPGRDRFYWLDVLGYLGLAGAIGGVVVHGALRVVLARRQRAS